MPYFVPFDKARASALNPQSAEIFGIGAAQLVDIAYEPVSKFYYAVDNTVPFNIFKSTDLVNWQLVYTDLTGDTPRFITAGNNKIIVGSQGVLVPGTLTYSTGGLVWNTTTTINGITDFYIEGGCYDNANDLFYISGNYTGPSGALISTQNGSLLTFSVLNYHNGTTSIFSNNGILLVLVTETGVNSYIYKGTTIDNIVQVSIVNPIAFASNGSGFSFGNNLYTLILPGEIRKSTDATIWGTNLYQSDYETTFGANFIPSISSFAYIFAAHMAFSSDGEDWNTVAVNFGNSGAGNVTRLLPDANRGLVGAVDINKSIFTGALF
jgi:hypothetical protein